VVVAVLEQVLDMDLMDRVVLDSGDLVASLLVVAVAVPQGQL